MIEACKHKSAAAAINWMVNLMKGKTDADRMATMATLSTMFTDMVEKTCADCAQNKNCDELEAASQILTAKPARDTDTTSSSSAPGALMIRRMNRRARLGRAPSRF